MHSFVTSRNVEWRRLLWATLYTMLLVGWSSLLTLKPNTHRRRRRDETVLSRRRRRCEHNSHLSDDDGRRIRSTILKLTKQTP